MEKKSNKLSLRLVLTLFLFIFAFGLISAAPTLVAPATSGIVTGTAVLNATNGTLLETLNCSFYARSTSTANSSYLYLANATNTSAGQIIFNTTFNSLLLEDSNDYSFYASCWNATGQSNSTASTSVRVDNTIPQAPSSLSPAAGTTDGDGIINFTTTVTGANTTGCILFFPNVNPGSKSYTMTHSGNLCWYQLTTKSEQTFDYIVEASDGTNKTNSSQTRININMQGGNSYLFQSEEAQQISEEKSGKTLSITDGNISLGETKIPIWGIVVVVLIIIAAVYFAKKK